MANPTSTERQLDRVIILFLFALFLLISPLVDWWAADDSTWVAPYLLWFILIAATFWLQRRRRRENHDV